MRALGGNFQMNKVYQVVFNVKKDATQDTQLQELRAEIAALKASMTK